MMNELETMARRKLAKCMEQVASTQVKLGNLIREQELWEKMVDTLAELREGADQDGGADEG